MTYKTTETVTPIGDQDKECSADLWWAGQERKIGSFNHFSNLD